MFNFQLIVADWTAASFRGAIEGAIALAGGSRAPWVIGNHDVPRPVSRYQLDEGFTPQTIDRLMAVGRERAEVGVRRARATALLLLALPGSAYIYQGEELGLPEVLEIPASARQDPRFHNTGGRSAGRDGCRVPLPWSRGGSGFGFSEVTGAAAPWLLQPPDWGTYSVEAQADDPSSFWNLYRMALRLRCDHPALGCGTLRWLEDADTGDLLCFAREPGFVFAANFGAADAFLPEHREIMLASEPISGTSLPPDTAAWLSA